MEQAENEQRKERKPNYTGRFLATAVFTIALAAGYFLLWAYVSYELRLSAEVIRAGLILLYILPCWIGGRVLRRCMPQGAVICGVGLGVLLYALLWGMHAVDGASLEITQTNVINCALCVLSAVVGTLHLKRADRERKA